MNRFVKGSLITAGILMAAGIVFCLISAAIGGSSMFYSIKNDVYLDKGLEKVGNSLENIADNVVGGRWYNGWGSKNPTYLTVNDKRVKDEIWEEQIPIEDIRNLSLELGAGEFYIREKESADGMVDIRIEGVGGCNYRVKDKTLHVEGFTGIKTFGTKLNQNILTLTFPADTSFREVDVEVGAGTMEIASVKAEELSAQIGAGELMMNQMEAKDLSVEIGAGRLAASNMYAQEVSLVVGMGECLYGGTVVNELEAECDMGNMELSLDGKESDYNYELECAAGNIDINDNTISALASERKIHNGASKNIELTCNMGNISIRFKE